MKNEEVKVKVNAEEPKSEKSADRKDAEKAKKPTAKELEQQVIFLTKQAADAQKKAREAEDKAKSEEVKLQTALSQYVRLQADFDNFRRRTKDNEAKAADTYKAETLVASDEMDDETIALVFQKGYLYKDTVLRPAKVQVVKNS